MKKFLKMVLWLPKTIFLMIWRIIWGFVQTVLVLAIIIFALIYYSNHSDSKFAHDIANVTHKIVAIYDAWKHTDGAQLTKGSKLKDKLSDHSTDKKDLKWPKNQAKIFIATEEPIFVNAYRAAITNWNQTGVFKLEIVKEKEKADIIADHTKDSSLQAAGLAKVKSLSSTKTIASAKVLLNAYYLLDNQYGYSSERIVHTAEHELGHAIGLEHDDANESVMQSSGSYYGIQKSDILKVKELYAS
ncbi:matrixin family metalloprotease [Streptococcus catagoni]|uniref:matrixin family metalloprotease n=1 Tax=Streptococcus catagoni TaxID=2654874 RepID=UPI00140970BC|nr:matrixin family metalloprotease [Streptococcus catagoni]